MPECGGCRLSSSAPEHVSAVVGDTALWFGSIPGYALDERGRLLLTDLQQHQVFRIDLEAKLVERIGREGQGPGEFVLPQLVAPGVGSTFVVYDAALRRLSKFGRDGALVRTMELSSPPLKAWAIAMDSLGNVFMSGTGVSGRGSRFVIHKYNSDGVWLKSFGDASEDFPDVLERLNGDGGPLWFDASTQTLWFSRGGPRFELCQFSTDGRLLRRIQFSGGVLATWRPRMHMTQSDGKTRVSAKSRLGSIALVPLPGRLLLNVTLLDDLERIRYDVLRLEDGSLVARWVEENQPGFVGLGDGRAWIFRFLPDDPAGITRQRVSFSGHHQ